MAVALYARVSTTRQAENDLSIPDQLRQLREHCKTHNLAVASEYVEPGASATDDRRPVFQQMIADATQPPALFDAILVHSRSRFFRDLFQFLHYERLLKKVAVKIVSITQQTGDDAAGEMASKLFSLFDEYQSKENAKHTQRAMQENARQGYWNGSVPSFGFRAATSEIVGNRGRHKRRLELDPVEAETVREIYRLYLAGHDGNVMGMKAIATHLNRQGLTMRGRPWRIQKVNRLLADSLYAGSFYFNRRDSRTHKERPQPEWIAVAVPAIIDAGAFERVAKRRAMSNPNASPPRATSSPALIGGPPQMRRMRGEHDPGDGPIGTLPLLQVHHKDGEGRARLHGEEPAARADRRAGAAGVVRKGIDAKARFLDAQRTAPAPAPGENRRGCPAHHDDEGARTGNDGPGPPL